jgi:hypothetical protein
MGTLELLVTGSDPKAGKEEAAALFGLAACGRCLDRISAAFEREPDRGWAETRMD